MYRTCETGSDEQYFLFVIRYCFKNDAANKCMLVRADDFTRHVVSYGFSEGMEGNGGMGYNKDKLKQD